MTCTEFSAENQRMGSDEALELVGYTVPAPHISLSEAAFYLLSGLFLQVL